MLYVSGCALPVAGDVPINIPILDETLGSGYKAT